MQENSNETFTNSQNSNNSSDAVKIINELSQDRHNNINLCKHFKEKFIEICSNTTAHAML
jgi:hypothetical protein